MLIPIIIFILVVYFIVKKGYLTAILHPSSKNEKIMTIEDKYNSKKVLEQKELNKLLEEINKKGYENLSEKEKKRLQQLSKN